MTTVPRPAKALRSPNRPGAARSVVLFIFAACLGAMAAPSPASAQNSYTRALKERIDRLQQEFLVLQRQVRQGGATATAAGGSSTVAPTQAARLELRISQFEDALRRLTGNTEELSYRVNQVSKRLDEVVASLGQRMDQLESRGPTWSEVPQAQSGDTAGTTTALAAVAQPEPQPSGQTLGQGQTGTAPGPRTLGTVAAADLEALRAQALQLQQGGIAPTQGTTQANLQTKSLPGNNAKEKYDYAFGLLSQANYPAAESALQAFLQQHPNDPLAGNAKYWLGETFYVRQLYKQAAVAFAEGFQQYPTSTKAPDNLLKLGKSLAALGQVEDACGTHAELLNRFPTAPATILQQAKSERQRLSCS